MKLSEVKLPNRLFASFLISRGYKDYLNRMRKTPQGYRCMNFEMNINESTIIEKHRFQKDYAGYLERLTKLITYKAYVQSVNGRNVLKTEVVCEDTLPYFL